MSSPLQTIIFVPIRFACTRGGETTYAIQYVAVPAGATVEEVRSAAGRVLNELLSGARTQFATSLPASGGGPLVCGYEILPITAIPRP